MIISRTYFVLNTEIAHTSDDVPNGSIVGNKSELDDFIKRYEKNILTKVFGYPLYKDFISNFDYDANTKAHTLNVLADTKWDELLNGKEYTLNGKTVLWPGIIFEDEDIPRSFIANYVFCYFLKKDVSKYMGVGLTLPESKNSSKAEPRSKYVESWNEFVELVVGDYCIKLGSSTELGNGIRSLYEYLNDMKILESTKYPNWSPSEFKTANIFGI